MNVQRKCNAKAATRMQRDSWVHPSCNLLLTLAHNSTEPCSMWLICESNLGAHNYDATTPFACLIAALWSLSRCCPVLWLTVKMRLRIRSLVRNHCSTQRSNGATCKMMGIRVAHAESVRRQAATRMQRDCHAKAMSQQTVVWCTEGEGIEAPNKHIHE
jgi:hypothetical protein